MKLIARFIPMAFLLGACLYAQQPQDPQQQPSTPQTPSTQPSPQSPSSDPSSQRPGSQMPGSQQSTPPSQQPQTPSASENQPSTDVTVTGKVVKSQGGLVIKDEASNSTYKVDNEDQLKQYMGKNVKVTGTLDAQTKTIHISNIEVAAS